MDMYEWFNRNRYLGVLNIRFQEYTVFRRIILELCLKYYLIAMCFGKAKYAFSIRSYKL